MKNVQDFYYLAVEVTLNFSQHDLWPEKNYNAFKFWFYFLLIAKKYAINC